MRHSKSDFDRVLEGGVSKGRDNWRTLRIPREDWGTLGKIRGTPTPLKNPIRFRSSQKLNHANLNC